MVWYNGGSYYYGSSHDRVGGGMVCIVFARHGYRCGLRTVAIVIFVSASVVLLFATRPLVKRLMRKTKGTETNLDLLLGSKALVLEDIRNDYGTGTVKINGIVWTARSADGTDIEKDTFVIIKEIQGNKVLVEKEKKE